MSSPSNLTILAWNANGLLGNKQELELLLGQEKIDIVLISETHYTSESFFKINNYKFYHTNHPRNTPRGGSGIFMKENINHYDDIHIQTDKVQLTSVTVHTKTYPLKIASIYCPPAHTLTKDEYTDLFKTLGNRFLLGGDFNAKHTHWGSRLITTKGRNLYNAMTDYKAEAISTGSPTYWPTDPQKIPDLLDFFVFKNLSSNYMMIEDTNELSSDHSAILLILSESIILKTSNPVLTNKRTDWVSFKLSLARKIHLDAPLQSKEQVDHEIEKLVDDIQSSAWENTPQSVRKNTGIKYPREILALVTEKRRARCRWQRTHAPSDKTTLNRLVRELRNKIKEIKTESINKYLSELSADQSSDYSLWRATKSLKRPIIQASPLKNGDGSWARDNESKAAAFAVHLANTFTPNETAADITPLEEEPYLDLEYQIP